MDEQIKDLAKIVTEVRLDLARIDTKVDSIKEMQNKVEDHSARIVAVEASAASAHHRLNGISKVVTGLAIGGGVAVIGVVINFVVKGGLAS